MWPFKPKKHKTIYRYRELDWSKVKTVEELIFILSRLNSTKQIKVSEDSWKDAPHLLKDTVIERVYNDGYLEETREYEEPLK